MDLSFRHDLWWALLPRSPRDAGRIELCVVRPARGERTLVPELIVEPGFGAVGDRWRHDVERTPGTELALINANVSRSVARDVTHAGYTGDNLHVDLDLSEANLPVGTRLVCDGVVLEVSPAVHRPCRTFHERFGKTAAQRVARANRRGLRGRGVLCSVIAGGVLRAGAFLTVVRPPHPTAQ